MLVAKTSYFSYLVIKTSGFLKFSVFMSKFGSTHKTSILRNTTRGDFIAFDPLSNNGEFIDEVIPTGTEYINQNKRFKIQLNGHDHSKQSNTYHIYAVSEEIIPVVG